MLAAAVASPEAFMLDLLFASLRTGAALALLPALGGQLIPVRVRIGLAGLVGFFVLSGPAPPAPPAELVGVEGVLAVMGEILIGGVVALALQAAFAAAAVAGEWLSQAMGLGVAALMAPTGPGPMLTGLFMLLMWVLFLGSNGHLLLMQVLVESYGAMPSAGALFQPQRLAAIASWGGFALASGLMAALPLGAAMLLLNLTLAVAARAAPQLNLFAVGFPLMLVVGLVGLPFALPAIGDSLGGALVEAQRRMGEVILG